MRADAFDVEHVAADDEAESAIKPGSRRARVEPEGRAACGADVVQASLQERAADALSTVLLARSHASETPGTRVGVSGTGFVKDRSYSDELIPQKGSEMAAGRLLVERVDGGFERLVRAQDRVSKRSRVGGIDAANLERCVVHG